MYVQTVSRTEITKGDFLWYEEFNPLFQPFRHKGMSGGRGGLKSWHTAAALLKLCQEGYERILGTREIQNTIKDSVHHLFERLINTYNFENFKVTETYIENLKTGAHVNYKGLLRNIHSAKSFEGYTRCWIEEAQSLSIESLDMLIPTMREAGSEIWYTWNPYSEEDAVMEKVFKYADQDPDVWHLKINLMDVPEIFQSKELMNEMRKDKERDYQKYLHIWEGEPVGQAPQAIMSIIDIKKAMERDLVINENDEIQNGADIAREGDDRIAFYQRQGFKTLKYKVHYKLKTPETERRLKGFIGENKRNLTNIDMGSMGSGIHDHLLEDGYNVNGIDFGGRRKLKRPDLYYDIATEMWMEFADKLSMVDIPDDPELKNELAKRQFFYKDVSRKEGSRMVDYTVKKVESKEDYKKRETKSPDKADGIIQAYYQPKQIGGFIGISSQGI